MQSVESPYQMLNLAIELITQAHAGQHYRNNGICLPYIWHLQGVREITNNMAIRPSVDRCDVEQVALLHDVVEDTTVTIAELKARGFSDAVVDAVRLLTFDATNQTRYEYIEAIKNNEIALVVKIADTLFNLTQSVHNRDSRRITRYSRQLMQLTNEETQDG